MKYTKQNIQKKRQILSSEKIRRNSNISLFLFKYAFIISIALIVTGLGLGVGFVRGILKTTPQITKDSVHSKGYITTIYDNKGSTIKTLSNHDSNRIYTPLPFQRIFSMLLLRLKMNVITAIMELICMELFEQPSLVSETNL
jgi:penicillin-binding protein 1A